MCGSDRHANEEQRAFVLGTPHIVEPWVRRFTFQGAQPRQIDQHD
jgi:hypothetical protein